MGWKSFFGFGSRKKEKEPAVSVTHLKLTDLRVGYFVDFDIKTWQVDSYNYYDWGGGDKSHEWRLKSHDDTVYLQRDDGDEAEWSIARPFPFTRLGKDIMGYIKKHEDPPDEIRYEGTTYYLEEFGGGHFYKDGTGSGQEFLAWSYQNENGEKYLTIEQWGEEEFEASLGESVEEYQFTNILPNE